MTCFDEIFQAYLSRPPRAATQGDARGTNSSRRQPSREAESLPPLPPALAAVVAAPDA